MKNIQKVLKDKKGEGYIDVIIFVLVAIIIIIFIIKVVPVFIKKQQLDNFATEIVRIAEVTGEIGTSVKKREEELKKSLGINPKIIWSKNDKFNLNEEISVVVELDFEVGLFSGFGSFPVTIRAKATGRGEMYWK